MSGKNILGQFSKIPIVHTICRGTFKWRGRAAQAPPTRYFASTGTPRQSWRLLWIASLRLRIPTVLVQAGRVAWLLGIKKPLFTRLLTRHKVVIVSYPKSGRTWLRVVLNELGAFPKFTHAGADPKHRRSAEDVAEGRKGREKFYQHRVVFLARDVRDTVVSHFFEATRRQGEWEGDIKAFIRDKHFGVEKIIAFNVAWCDSARSFKDFKLVTYEEMKRNMATVVADIWEFSGLPLATAKGIEQVVNNNQFDRMQEREHTGQLYEAYGDKFAKNGQDNTMMKVREGNIGGFLKYLDCEDIEYCDMILKKYRYSEIVGDFDNKYT